MQFTNVCFMVNMELGTRLNGTWLDSDFDSINQRQRQFSPSHLIFTHCLNNLVAPQLLTWLHSHSHETASFAGHQSPSIIPFLHWFTSLFAGVTLQNTELDVLAQVWLCWFLNRAAHDNSKRSRLGFASPYPTHFSWSCQIITSVPGLASRLHIALASASEARSPTLLHLYQLDCWCLKRAVHHLDTFQAWLHDFILHLASADHYLCRTAMERSCANKQASLRNKNFKLQRQ